MHFLGSTREMRIESNLHARQLLEILRKVLKIVLIGIHAFHNNAKTVLEGRCIRNKLFLIDCRYNYNYLLFTIRIIMAVPVQKRTRNRYEQ